jgi:hypothetical protein
MIMTMLMVVVIIIVVVVVAAVIVIINETDGVCLFVCLFLARQPPVGQGLLIHEVCRSYHTR